MNKKLTKKDLKKIVGGGHPDHVLCGDAPVTNAQEQVPSCAVKTAFESSGERAFGPDERVEPPTGPPL